METYVKISVISIYSLFVCFSDMFYQMRWF